MAQEKLIDKVNDTPLRKIAYPLVIENLLFLAFSSIDVFMLSGYSDNAVAAVGLITQYTWFLLLLLQVIPNGATISLTNFLGAGQVEKAKKISRTALQMVIVFGLFFGLVFAFLIPQILKKYNIDDEVRLFASQYAFIYSAFSVFSGISIVQSSILRSYGHTKDAMVVNAIANSLNIVGNALALYGWFGIPILGVKGVAISTVASQFAGAIILSARIACLKDSKYSIKNPFKIVKGEWRQILKIGVPTAGESVSWNLSQLVIMIIITTFGTEAIAALSYDDFAFYIHDCYFHRNGFSNQDRTLLRRRTSADCVQKCFLLSNFWKRGESFFCDCDFYFPPSDDCIFYYGRGDYFYNTFCNAGNIFP